MWSISIAFPLFEWIQFQSLLRYTFQFLFHSANSMAFPRAHKPKPKPRSPIIFFFVALAAIAFLFLFSSLISTNGASSLPSSNSIQKIFRFKNLTQKQRRNRHVFSVNDKFLYWGNRIDCPGKHCESCEGLGHQESSLRCALEEAMFLQR